MTDGALLGLSAAGQPLTTEEAMEQRGRMLDERTRRVFSNRWRLAGALLMLMAVAGLFACAEATDQPEDCRGGEYFDEANESCEACPAIPEPDCRPGCGFHIEEDDRGCPVAQCGLSGSADTDDGDIDTCRCPAGEFFDDDSLSCQSCDAASDPPAICDDQTDEQADDF